MDELLGKQFFRCSQSGFSFSTRYASVLLRAGALCEQRLRDAGAQCRCRVIGMGRYFSRWQGFDKICDSFTVPLTVPKKLHAEVAVFAPTNDRDFYGQGRWLLSHSNLQREIGSCV